MAKDGIRRRLRRERDPEGRMSLGDHLRELRNRTLKAILAILIGAGVGWWQYDRLFRALDKPIRDLAATRAQSTVTLAFTDVTGSFSLRVTVSLFVGLLLASPVWLYQLWAFIVPGLTGKEKRVTVLFIGAVGAALPRRVHLRLPHPAAGGQRAAELHARLGGQHPARPTSTSTSSCASSSPSGWPSCCPSSSSGSTPRASCRPGSCSGPGARRSSSSSCSPPS